MKRVDEIINGSYKVTEKKDMLNKLREELNEEINKAIEQVENDYKYCPKCKEYYRNKAWDTEYKTENREVCTFYNPCEFGEDRYEHKVCSVKYDICPMGHIIERNVTW